MINLTSKDRPDSFEYFQNLSYDKRVFFDIAKVRNTMIYERALSITEQDLAVDSLFTGLADGGLYLGDMEKFGGSRVSRDLILQFLCDEVGPNRQHLLKVYDKETHTSKYSLDKNNVLQTLLESGIAVEFLSEFIAFREHKKAAADMQKKVNERFDITEVPGIWSLRYDLSRAATGRLYTNNENIQNIAKLYLPSMCGPTDDYVLIWGDFDQIDLRVAYYTVISESVEDDEIFQKYDDKYEAMARIIDRKLGRDFNIDKFTDNRKKYKKGILARCYGQALQQLIQTVGDRDFATMLDKYFLENDRYGAWLGEVKDVIESHDEVDMYTYFGNVNHVKLDDCSTGEQKIDRLLNNPIQSTSNDIIMHMVNKTVRDFRAQGVDEEKFRVYMIRHDEPVFMLHRDYLHLAPIIRNNTILQVDDWGVLTMSLGIGKYYSEEDEELMKYFGDDDIASGGIVRRRADFYDPFIKDTNESTHITHGDQLSIVYDEATDSNVLCINKQAMYTIVSGKHVRKQVVDFLSEYTLKQLGLTAKTFVIDDDFPMPMYNVYVNNVYLSFVNVKGGDIVEQ